jgi:hypothetical protein
MIWNTHGQGLGGRGKTFYFTPETVSGPLRAAYPVRTGVSFHWGKRPGREADHSFLSSVDVTNGVGTLALHHTSSWRDDHLGTQTSLPL